jgi:hypothetical protein
MHIASQGAVKMSPCYFSLNKKLGDNESPVEWFRFLNNRILIIAGHFSAITNKVIEYAA